MLRRGKKSLFLRDYDSFLCSMVYWDMIASCRKELIQITPKEVREKFVYDFALALVARSKRSLLHKVENLTYFRRHPHASSNLLQNVKGGFRGYLDGFLSLGKRNRLEISDRYRLMLPYLSMEEPLVYQYALYLSSGRILGIFRAGWITYVCRSELRGNTKSIMNKVRAYFLPLFLYGKWKYIRSLWGEKTILDK